MRAAQPRALRFSQRSFNVMAQLFRQEAIDAQREKLLGAVSAARPVPTWVFTALAASVAVALVAFAFWGEYTRRERVEGFLTTDSGAARLLAPEAGVVTELLAKEGTEVAAGTLIAKLAVASGRVAQSRRSELQDRKSTLQAQIATTRALAAQQVEQLRSKIMTMNADMDQAKGEIDLQTSRVASAQAELQKVEKLVRERFYSESEALKRKDDLLEQSGKLKALERQRGSLERDLLAARADLANSELTLDQQLAPLQRQISEVEGQLAQIEAGKDFEVKAPLTGVITNVAVARGDSVAADAQIATVLPKGSGLRAQLLVPTRAAGFIQPGNPVVLRYDAFPYQRFGQYRGEVEAVSGTVWSPGEKVGPVVVREPVYRVDVKLDSQTVLASGQELALRSGMTVSADILLEKRTIFEWVFEPVLELRERLKRT
jgi:membrane fusion protein